MIDKSLICEKYLKKTGKEVCVVKTDGSEETFFAAVEQTWRKNKTRFEDISTKIGRVYNDYYIYIGPAKCDITQLCEDDYLLCDGIRYMFVKTERVIVGRKVQFYAGVLKRIWESDENVFE